MECQFGELTMWEVNTVTIGKIVVNAFNGLELMLARLRKDYGENRVMILLQAPEDRVFDQHRLAILTIDVTHVFDFCDQRFLQEMAHEYTDNNEISFSADENSMSAVIWNGSAELSSKNFLSRMIQGRELKVIAFFKPFDIMEVNVPLSGFGDAFHEAFENPKLVE
jgi:hypothetical protein